MIVSIIIPYFKNRDYIKRTIKSVLSQNFKNYEILIIYDDTSQEDFLFIKNLKKMDKRIKVINNKKNYGAGISRNIGIKKSKGKYISFLDSDDTWNKNKLLLQIKFMEKNNYDITHTSYNIVKKTKILSTRIAKNLTYHDLINSCDIGLSTVIIKKKIISFKNPFPPLKTKEDFVLWLRLSKKGYKFYGLQKTLTNWTKRNNSLSSSIYQKIKDAIKVYYFYENMNMVRSFYQTIKLSINFLKK